MVPLLPPRKYIRTESRNFFYSALRNVSFPTVLPIKVGAFNALKPRVMTRGNTS